MRLPSLLIVGLRSVKFLLSLQRNQVEVFMLRFIDFILIVRVGADAELIMDVWLRRVKRHAGWK
jgi:hypothetical protein